MPKQRLNRVDVYEKICRRLRLKQEHRVLGYFTSAQMKIIWEYIESTDMSIQKLDRLLDEAIEKAEKHGKA